MRKKKSRLKIAQEQAERAINKTNEKISELGTYTGQLYDELNTIQGLFDDICICQSKFVPYGVRTKIWTFILDNLILQKLRTTHL